MTTSLEVRNQLAEALEFDLIGPSNAGPQASEVLPYAPSRWYLSGFLVPREAPEEQRADEDASEQLEMATGDGFGADEDQPEKAAARKTFFPSSIGISVLVPSSTKNLRVTARWGDYKPLDPLGDDEPHSNRAQRWQRVPLEASVDVPLAKTNRAPKALKIDGHPGLELVVTIRPVANPKSLDGEAGALPAGTRSVSLFFVNNRESKSDQQRDEAFVFQAGMRVRCEEGLVPRPNLRGLVALDDQDERIADVQYRDCFEFAVGHGISTHAFAKGEQCNEVGTCWIPSADVEKVVPGAGDIGLDLRMKVLGACATAAEVKSNLGALTTAYATWIAAQAKTKIDGKRRRDVVDEMLKRAENARKRIDDGLACLEQADVLDAFRIANRAMATAALRRNQQQSSPKKDFEPSWRPFQIAFLLMNLRGICDPGHADREIVDLLFFPTGGGKTEAYLGLAAFTLVLRRLRNPGVQSAGVTVLMRYTLRLLTLDQLGRAATLICALERERQNNVTKLGPWPFEIGLWVGKAATPNEMGRKGDNQKETARARTIAYQGDEKKPSPVPIESCPWCGEPLKPASFKLTGPGDVIDNDHPTNLRILCLNRDCEFRRMPGLPILAVDEPIYRRLPCFLIATLDKFAALPWAGRTGALFGRVERHDDQGFYGPCDSGEGRKLERALLPPELIIQDELHLISGPLGTMAGLYESAIDALATREQGGKTIRPKIVASTATVRRAEKQILALFARRPVDVFPPPGPNRRDSFFALTRTAEEMPARRYLGISAPGKSLKVVLLRTYLALLGAAQKLYQDNGGTKNESNPADPYMTLLGYFSSLRELGGARRIIEDEVRSRLETYGMRAREGETSPFSNRWITFEVEELTSRLSNSAVAKAKRRLELGAREKEHVDVALATNMISVGLDITRLGLMVVFGQPKMTAEYIQATSRVGRDETRPGLVVTLLNVHRPRDRSHYERFEAYHESFYRAVEATSVTPFSPRAIDRGLPGVTVALARQGRSVFTPARAAYEMRTRRADADFVADLLAKRAERADEDPETQEKLRNRTKALLDDWASIAQQNGPPLNVGLQYQREESNQPRLLFEPLSPELATVSPRQRQFRANRSLRDVEPSVNLWVKRSNGEEVVDDEEDT